MTRETISHRVPFEGKIKSYKYNRQVSSKSGAELISSSTSYFLAGKFTQTEFYLFLYERLTTNRHAVTSVGQHAVKLLFSTARTSVQFVHPRSEIYRVYTER